MAGKRIVICCDGTGNTFEDLGDESNVAKLYSALTLDSQQIGYYHPGVGTMGAPTSRNWLDKNWTRAKGLAFGAGLMANVGDAYRYLMDNYADGDEIFLFGFSRGAFTARVLASLMHVYGLLCAGNHQLIPYIFQMFAKQTRAAKRLHRTFPSDEPFKWQFSHSQEVRIRFVGVWDTVSSYGWIYDPILLPFLGCNPIIDIGRHAVSIHERRCFYQDNLWGAPGPGQNIRQVWFSGVHSDVGGSYPEKTSGLSKIALEWMLVEAMHANLRINTEKARVILGECRPVVSVPRLPHYAQPNAHGCLHESLKGAWWIPEYLPQQDPHQGGKRWYLPRGRRRIIPPGSRIHESVFLGEWRPPNLPQHSVEPWVRFDSMIAPQPESPAPVTVAG